MGDEIDSFHQRSTKSQGKSGNRPPRIAQLGSPSYKKKLNGNKFAQGSEEKISRDIFGFKD